MAPGRHDRVGQELLKATGILLGILVSVALVAGCGASQGAAPTSAPIKAAAPAAPTSAPAAAPSSPTSAPAPAPTAKPEAPAAWTPKSEITFVVPMAPGGSQDPLGRMLSQESEPLLGQKIVVVNKPGASSTVGTAEVAQAKPDGYKIGLSGYHVLAFYPLVSKLPFQSPDKDYAPLIKLTEIPTVLAVSPNAPWKTIKDLVDDAKARPGEIRVAVSGKYSGSDLALLQFMLAAKIKLTSVPFASGGEAITAAMGGHTEGAISTPVNIAPQVKAGKLRALAVIDKKTADVLPGTEATVPAGINASLPTVFCVVGPKGLDKGIVDTYYKAFSQAMKTDKFQKFAKENGYIVDPLPPAELSKQILEWQEMFKTLIAEMKIESVTL